MIPRGRQILDEHRRQIYRQTDRLFALLMMVQWAAAIGAALWISPTTWIGRTGYIHLHVWAAIFLGGAITLLPVALALLRAGHTLTRHVIAVAQMLMSALLIHLTGGRIETHFHIFGSLAFLSFYRDWKVLVPATAVVACDHLVRGLYFPQSVFGDLTASSWRWVEYVAWVVFEDVILVKSCLRGADEMRGIALRQARLEELNRNFEQQVHNRTAELRENQAKLQAVLETAHEGIVTADHNGRIIFFNPGAERMFERTYADTAGQPLSILIAPRFREDNPAAMSKLFMLHEARGIRETAEMAGVARDGREFPIEVSLAAWNAGGPAFVTAIIRDVTERKRSEAELLEAKEEAEAANRAKSQFLANISHEIRTPMNGIIGMTDLALETDLNPDQFEYLNTVKNSAETLLTLINDILDFSKIEAGKLSLDPIEFNLRDHLGQTMKTQAIRAHQKGLELACSIPPEVPEFVAGDPTRLRQILVNLVGNAIKFTSHGEIVLRVKQESRDAGGIVLHFSVSDTGIGILPSQQKLIFEPFTQADASTTRQYGGTGLGLSISLRLVELMAGKIWLESEAGSGTTFHFTVRVGVPATEASVHAVADPAVLQNMRVLIVDDNETNRQILETLFSHWLMKPAAVSDARYALAALRQARAAGDPFSLLIVDCHMPVTDGFMLVEQVRTDPGLASIATIMLTSGGRRGDAARCREPGIAAYLNQPVLQPDLLETLLKVVGAREASPEHPRLVTRHTLREGRSPLRVLLAEDNVVNQRLMVRLLENQGHLVTTADDGLAALRAVENHTFDLILMDVQMPVMDGLQATAAIREKESRGDTRIPIIALTAHAMAGDRERFLSGGMDSYISKPVRPDDLFRTIEDLLQPSPMLPAM